MDLATALLLLVCFVAVLAVVVVRARGGVAASSPAGLALYRGPEATAGVFAGLIGTLAVVQIATPAASGSGAALGAGCGVLFALLSGRLARRIRGVLLGVLGVAGSVAAVVGVLTAGCSALPFPVRLLTLLLVAIPAAITILAAALTGRLRLRSALAVFGVVEIVAFLSTPFGVSLVDTMAPAWMVACVAAGLLGAAAGVAPDLVIGLTGLGLSVATFVVGGTVGSGCSGMGIGQFLTIAAYLVVFGLARLVTLRVLP